MHCIAALAVLKQFWCRVIKRLRITLLCPWCYYILWWLSSIKIYKIGGSETLKQWLSSIRIIIYGNRGHYYLRTAFWRIHRSVDRIAFRPLYLWKWPANPIFEMGGPASFSVYHTDILVPGQQEQLGQCHFPVRNGTGILSVNYSLLYTV